MAQPEQLDKWANWLLHRRDGDDEDQRRQTLDYLLPVRDRVLDNARLRPGQVMLDVGAGDGLIAFGAVERVAPDGKVVLSDISDDLVSHSRSVAEDLDVAENMSFVVARAEDLSAIDAASVDVVTTRSVLIYVADKVRERSRSSLGFSSQGDVSRSSNRSTATSPTRPTSSGATTRNRSRTLWRRSTDTRDGCRRRRALTRC